MRKIFKDIHAWAFSTLSRLPSTYKSELYESIFLSWVWIFGKQWLWGWRKLFFLEIERAHISSLYIRYIWENEMCTYILRKLGYSKRSNIGEVLWQNLLSAARYIFSRMNSLWKINIEPSRMCFRFQPNGFIWFPPASQSYPYCL